jgi:DNA-binding MarR family transcriptional regulator
LTHIRLDAKQLILLCIGKISSRNLPKISRYCDVGCGRVPRPILHAGVPTKAQAGLLFLIAHEDAPTTKALAERIGTTPSAVTQLIDGLIKERLVIRTEDETDRRKVRLSLSDEGKRRLKEMKKIHLEAITKLSSTLSESELDQLHLLLKKMVEPTN